MDETRPQEPFKDGMFDFPLGLRLVVLHTEFCVYNIASVASPIQCHQQVAPNREVSPAEDMNSPFFGPGYWVEPAGFGSLPLFGKGVEPIRITYPEGGSIGASPVVGHVADIA